MEQVSGKYVITSFGEQEIYYGVEFATPPRLEILEGFDNPEKFALIEQRGDGFKFIVGGAFTSGTLLVWQATGRVKSADKSNHAEL